jgi:methylglutamate dehydrogenase subunit D
VPSFKLTPAASLASQSAIMDDWADNPGVVITERGNISLCSVIPRKASGALLANRVRAELGVELPRTPKTSGPGAIEFIWAGPNRWLALSEGNDSRALEQRLRVLLGAAASLTDQSDGWSILRVAGSRARDALAKGVHIDLHGHVFRAGDVAMTAIAHINVHLWQVDEQPTYDLAVFRSFAVALWEWLTAAAAEFGFSTKPL